MRINKTNTIKNTIKKENTYYYNLQNYRFTLVLKSEDQNLALVFLKKKISL